jgi:hypothetical protein
MTDDQTQSLCDFTGILKEFGPDSYEVRQWLMEHEDEEELCELAELSIAVKKIFLRGGSPFRMNVNDDSARRWRAIAILSWVGFGLFVVGTLLRAVAP